MERPMMEPLKMEGLSDEEVIDRARDAVIPRCVSPCASRCCRSGKVNTSKEESLARVLEKRQPGRTAAAAQEWDGSWSIPLEDGCPALRADLRCAAYADRPQACRSFPLFVYGKTVVVAPTCPAADLLAPFIAELVRRGYKVA